MPSQIAAAGFACIRDCLLLRHSTFGIRHWRVIFPRSTTLMLLTLLSCCALAATRSEAQPETGTGLEGEIRIGPGRGGPVRIGVTDSRPLARTIFVVKKAEKIIASFETDDQGRFRVSLPPGKYTVSKRDGKVKVGSYGPFEVEIVGGQMKKVQWECDTGMD
jgi:hypothetical protein